MTRITFERDGVILFDADLGRVVAEGGGGVVQEARRADSGSKTIIVKRARSGGEPLLEVERRTCEQLDHPCVVRYLGSAAPEGIGPLLAFEALADNPLLAFNGAAARSPWRDPGTPYYPLPPNRAIELAYDLLLALEHLHERGFVHADVKLSNVLTRIDGPRDHASLLRAVAEGRFTGVLIDLGSVRPLSVLAAITRGDADPSLIPSITPLYAPPEALFERAETGGRKVFSPVMDTYSFGLVFYALLTGRIPYAHLVRREKLKETETVLDLKNQETRRTVSPVDLKCLSRIPLHDVGFEGSALSVWPQFHAAASELLVRCLDPDPETRMEARVARAFFQDIFRIRAPIPPKTGEAPPRAWVQNLFQMRARSNRLTKDAPLGGLRIREEQSGAVLVEEAAPPLSAAVLRDRLDAGEDGSTISFHANARRASGRLSKAPPPPKGMIYLADVLREYKARRPLPVTAPVIVTRTSLAPTELVKCTLFSLEQAREHVKISDGGADQVRHGHRISAGRGDDNDIVVADPGVSKRHIFLEKGSDGGWWVIDNHSSNGTFVDDVELQRGGKIRLTRGLVTIGLGLTKKLTFMDGAELDGYLARALEVWTQAFAGKASGRHPKVAEGGTLVQREEKSSTEVVAPEVDATPLTPAASPRAPTRRQRREDLIQMPPAVALPGTPGSRPRPLAATPEELAKKLAELADVNGYAVHFAGARSEDCESATEVLDYFAAGDDVLGVDAILRTGKRLFLYRKPGSEY